MLWFSKYRSYGKILSQISHMKNCQPLLTRNFHSNHFLLDTMKITMPALSPTMTEGVIVKWAKKEGEKCSAGDVLFEIETDKATMEVESSEDGVVAKILAKAGEKVSVNTLVALLVEEGDDWKSVSVPDQAPKTTQKKETTSNSVSQTAQAASLNPTTAPSSSAFNLASKGTKKPLGPAVKLLLANHGLDVNDIVATGPQGRLLKGDVLYYLEQVPEEKRKKLDTKKQESSTTPHAVPLKSNQQEGPKGREREKGARSYREIPLSNMRKVIASRLTESKKNIPHAYASIVCRIDEANRLREKLLKEFDTKISINDIFVKAASLALKKVPQLNATYQPSTGDVQISKSVDISVAVATPGGLITPIITNADSRGLRNINEVVKDMASRARVGKLKPQEYQGGSFSISNLGMFGIHHFSAVINPPQTCILAVGGGIKKPFPSKDLGEDFQVGTFTKVQLSYDERAVNAQDASQWLSSFKDFVENPVLMV
eukprot:Sdes_comp18638_c0_seq1m8835